MTCLSSNKGLNEEVFNQRGKLKKFFWDYFKCYVLFNIGLELDHAYSILDARQVGSQRLVRLRNPWGKKERNGSFSDNWTKCPRILKEKLPTCSENDGVFWMRMY